MSDIDTEIEWILRNGLHFAEGRFGHQVVVIRNRKVIFRVKSEEMPAASALVTTNIPLDTPEKDQQKDIVKALRMVKAKFGDPEIVKCHQFGDDQAILTLHFKTFILFVFGFTAM